MNIGWKRLVIGDMGDPGHHDTRQDLYDTQHGGKHPYQADQFTAFAIQHIEHDLHHHQHRCAERNPVDAQLGGIDF